VGALPQSFNHHSKCVALTKIGADTTRPSRSRKQGADQQTIGTIKAETITDIMSEITAAVGTATGMETIDVAIGGRITENRIERIIAIMTDITITAGETQITGFMTQKGGADITQTGAKGRSILIRNFSFETSQLDWSDRKWRRQ